MRPVVFSADDKSLMKYMILFSLVTLFALSFLFPYSLDDWAWGGSVGIERLLSGFDNYNGRYLGNLVVIAMTRSVSLRAVFFSSVLVGISYLSYLICDKRIAAYPITLALLLSVSIEVKAQTIVWASGFANYVVPCLFVYQTVYFASQRLKKNPESLHPVDLFGYFLVGFLGSLFMENVSIYLFCAGVALLFFCGVKYRRIDFGALCLTAAASFGLLFMFSNEAYRHVAAGDDFYRSVNASTGLLGGAIDKYLDCFVHWLFLDNLFLPIILILGSILYLRMFAHAFPKSSRLSYMPLSLAFFFLAAVFISQFDFGISSSLRRIVVGCSILGFYLTLIYLAVFISRLHQENYLPLFITVSSLVVLAPLFVVNPVTPRTVFPVFALLSLLAVYYLTEGADFGRTFLVMFGSFCSVVSVFVLVLIYLPIHIADVERMNEVERLIALGENTVHVAPLPNDVAVWDHVVNQELWGPRFRDFYNLPDNVTVILDQAS